MPRIQQILVKIYLIYLLRHQAAPSQTPALTQQHLQQPNIIIKTMT
jgi:hypothetical protein